MLHINRIRYPFILALTLALAACGGTEEAPANKAPSASGVTLSDDNKGKIVVGVTLTGNYSYTDVEDDVKGKSTFRWLRNGVAISGNTGQSYTLVAADSEQTISFEVTPVAETGEKTGTAVRSAGVMVANSAPTAIDVGIADNNKDSYALGDTLTGNYTFEDLDGDLEDVSSFSWLLNGEPISGAITITYVVTAADVGQALTFEVTPVAATGITTGSAVRSVDNAPIAEDVSISGNIVDDSAEVGVLLTGSYRYVDSEGNIEGDTTFQWLRNGVAIEGATSTSYTLVLEDSGRSISFEVTPVAQTGTPTGIAKASKGVSVINHAPTAESDSVTITDDNGGSAVVGDALTGKYKYVDTENDLEGTHTFRWLRNGIAIRGATTKSYTLVELDVPALITFEFTAVAQTGEKSGVAVTSPALATGTAPIVSGFGRYLDINKNAVNDAGDQLVIPFDQHINTKAMKDSDFTLAVTNDSFGTGASVAAGPARNEVTITLGTSPKLTTRGDFLSTTTLGGSASGVDVAASITPEAIVGISGIDAVQSAPIDLIPTYVDSLQSLAENDSLALALGNVDGVGGLDIVVANSDSQANRIYSNDGSGSFTDSGQPLGSNNSYALALGDIDNDTDLDLVVANWGQGNRVYLNDGTGSFVDSGQSLGSNWSSSVALSDIDGDGDLDMMVANWNQGNRVYRNNGSGAFTDSGQSLGTHMSYAVAMGDVDGDGDLDMTVANYYGQGNRVYHNDGAGNFTDSGQGLGSGNSLAVALGDVDIDGDLDMVVANYSGQANRVYSNDGSGNFTDSGQSLGANHSSSVALADVDADNDLDMLVANNNDQGNRVYINDGSGSFSDSGQSLGENDSFAIALGDVDGDGDLDMVVVNRGQGNRVYFSSLSGT